MHTPTYIKLYMYIHIYTSLSPYIYIYIYIYMYIHYHTLLWGQSARARTRCTPAATASGFLLFNNHIFNKHTNITNTTNNDEHVSESLHGDCGWVWLCVAVWLCGCVVVAVWLCGCVAAWLCVAVWKTHAFLHHVVSTCCIASQCSQFLYVLYLLKFQCVPGGPEAALIPTTSKTGTSRKTLPDV